MKNLKHFFILLLILSPLCFYSQNGFIEVEVTDSIQIKAISFEYTVTPQEDYGAIYEEEDSEEDEKISEMNKDMKDKAQLNTLLTFLKEKKYNFKSTEDSNYNINNNKINFLGLNNSGFVVSLNTIDELKRLVSDLKQLDKISGEVSKIKYENASIYEDALMKKLIEKAKSKAATIAKLSTLTLGKIIEVKEVKEAENSNLNFMEMIMKLDKRGKFSGTGDITTSNLDKSIIVKFKAD